MTFAEMDRLLYKSGKVSVTINEGPNAGKVGVVDNIQSRNNASAGAAECRVRLANGEGVCWIPVGNLSLTGGR